jgi:hypothetical protein
VPAIAEFRRVLQILLNLLGNAIRYAPEGSSVRLKLSDRKGRARVSVIDEGPGLSAEQQTRVFEKFERLGRSGDGGSGLGLYISRRLARAMGGDLSVKSKPGQGASFRLDLPPNPAKRRRPADYRRRLPPAKGAAPQHLCQGARRPPARISAMPATRGRPCLSACPSGRSRARSGRCRAGADGR